MQWLKGQLDQDRLPVSGARLCLTVKSDVCYRMPPHAAEGAANVRYEFGLDPHARRLPINGGGSWVLFFGSFSGGGSGTLTRLAILRFDSRGAIVNLLPYVAFSDVSETAIWTQRTGSSYPVLVVADFIWRGGEIHFGPHFYTVSAWKFEPALDRYIKAFSYRTAKQYDGGDATPISVLRPERPEILRRLNRK